jgi:hypothetical protein
MPCTIGGIVAGVLFGAIMAVDLPLVSPNLIYPKAVNAAPVTASAKKYLAALDKPMSKSNADLAKWGQ